MTWIKKTCANSIKDVFLHNIGCKSLADVNTWFQKSYNNEYRIDKLAEAASFCLGFKNKKVTIIGDYDTDGINSTAILYLVLMKMGFKDVSFRIPKRFTEGFGINPSIIAEIDSGLIITCDNGVAQIDSITLAKEKGLSVIIIDHHKPVTDKLTGEALLPPADIIIDPNAIENSADFNGYCGAGLSYRFAKQLLAGEYQSWSQALLIFAAIGTVGDVMNLHEENYVFVRNGLKLLSNRTCCTMGLSALLSQLNLTTVTADDIGFKISPVLNASSRLKDDGAVDSLMLLIGNEPYNVMAAKASHLIENNEHRKELQKEAVKEAEDYISKNDLLGNGPLVIYLPSVKEGIIGIVAGNMCEKYGLPAIVFCDSLNCLKGSARAPEGYDMKEHLDKCSDYILKYGGHSGAAGLSIEPSKLEAFTVKLRQCSDDYTPDTCDNEYYDLEIDASDIGKYIPELLKYAPYGQGNKEPIFKITNFSVIPQDGVFIDFIGKGKSIAKIRSQYATAIRFKDNEELMVLKNPNCFEFLGNISYNQFNGSVENQILFKSYKIIENHTIHTELAEKIASMS